MWGTVADARYVRWPCLGDVSAVSVLFLNKAWEVPGGYLFKTLAVSAICAAALTAVASTLAALSLEMARIGTRHTAIVTAERKVDPWYLKTENYYYQLSVDGRRLTGELITGSDDFDPGDVVDVYSDPARGWHELAPGVEDSATIAAMAGVVYLISLPLCWATGYFAPLIAFEDSERS